jgi:hypothetical protein
MDTFLKSVSAATPLVWSLFAIFVLLAYRKPLLELFTVFVRRIQRGDEVKIATWITLGKSVGPLKVPHGSGYVTDDHLALIHRSWRVAHRDAEFQGHKMYQVHVILFGDPEALDRVEYVLYHLDPVYPEPVKSSSSRVNFFELKELANGYSLLRAEVKIKDQEELIYLSRFIDLTEVSEKLKGSVYFT